ncbi:MAG: class I SAM-dependent methyltransferase, partial [Gemmataceae bacterium]
MHRPLLGRLFPNDGHHVAGWQAELLAVLPAQGRVLDLGCGAFRDLTPLRSASLEVWGADFVPHAQLAHPLWFRPLSSDGSIPFADHFFHVVFANMVAEHVERPNAFLTEVQRVLQPGGALILHTISGDHYVAWFRRLIGLLPDWVNEQLVWHLYGRRPEDTFVTYYRMNTQRDLARAGRRVGLPLQRVRRYADPGYFRFSSWMMNAATLLDRFLEDWEPGWGRLYLTATFRKPVD